MKFVTVFRMYASGGGGGEETMSGTEKRCCHNLQSGDPAVILVQSLYITLVNWYKCSIIS